MTGKNKIQMEEYQLKSFTSFLTEIQLHNIYCYETRFFN